MLPECIIIVLGRNNAGYSGKLCCRYPVHISVHQMGMNERRSYVPQVLQQAQKTGRVNIMPDGISMRYNASLCKQRTIVINRVPGICQD